MTAPEGTRRASSAAASGRISVPPEAVRGLAKLLLERIGLRPGSGNEAGLRLALLARLEALGAADAGVYLERLEGDDEELRALLPLVTVGKTEFFRDAQQCQALRGSVLPQLLARARSERRRLGIWSAGCATGEEPYSIAMLAVELGAASEELDLLATDVNPAAVAAAAAGRYPAKRLRGVPDSLLERFWRAQGEEYVAGPALRRCVHFAVHNLAAASFPSPESAATWDLILCRNVLIYFDAPRAARVVRRFFEGLRGGGILCLGYSESLFRLNADFELVEVGGAFLYGRPPGRTPGRAPERRPRSLGGINAAGRGAQRFPSGSRGDRPEPSSSFCATAHRARLAQATEQPEAKDPLSAAVADLDAGHFEEAVAGLRRALERAPGGLALWLTLGNALTLLRRRKEARAAYDAALALEPLCGEAHLFRGILCFEEGETCDEEAARDLGKAVFLDPECVLAHYYLGRLHERRADLPAARRAYRNAVDSSRAAKGRGELLGYYPDLPSDPAVLGRAAGYALRAAEELCGD